MFNSGTSLERVRRVHLHPPKFGNGCAAPVLRTVDLYQGRPLGPKIAKLLKWQWIVKFKWMLLCRECLLLSPCTRPVWTLTRSLINTNPVLSDSGATLKFEFCMLKNITHADFQLKIWTPGILAAIRSSVKRLWNYNTGVNGFQKILCVVDRRGKTDVLS